MLGKLFKYEFKATGRIMLPIYIATLVICIISSVFFNFAPSGEWDEHKLLTFTTLIIFALFIFMVAAAIVLSYIISILRFKKNLFDSEGYLMNTLPVTTGQNIGAKLLTSVIYQIFTLIVAILAFMIFTIGIDPAENINMLGELYNLFVSLINHMTGEIFLFTAEFIILCILSLVLLNIEFYAAISIGHSSNSSRVLKSVAAYIVFYVIQNIIDSILLIICGLNIDTVDTNSFPYLLFTGLIIIEVIYILIYYFITNYFMKKKLNLQ